jgi:3-isopropylmalate/(R)-2-methylmalate dehydratase small subunit
MEDRIAGRAIRLGDNVDTDQIFPGRYLQVLEPAEIARHALEGADEALPARIRPGDIVVAGRNFGAGSSREQAVTSLKFAGVAAAVVGSAARIFYRNAINRGFPVVQCPAAAARARDGDPIEVDFTEGWVEVDGARFSFVPIPDFIMEILREGGLVPYTRKQLAQQARS